MRAPETKFFRVLTLNAIADAGINVIAESSDFGNPIVDPHAIIVRSTKVNVDDYWNGLLAIARAGAGVDNISVDKATARGIPVFYAPGANANSVVELGLTAAGMAARNLEAALAYVRALDPNLGNDAIHKKVEAEKKRFVGFELAGKQLGVIGMGQIGGRMAKAAIARGMTVIAYDPMLPEEAWAEMEPGIHRAMNPTLVARRADILSVHVTLSEKTKHLVNEAVIAEMKKGAILLNFSREPVCEEAAVLRALESDLRAFVTDFPTEATLRHLKVLPLPHLGASTEEAEERSAVMAAKALNDYLLYGVVKHSVNFPEMDVRPRAGIHTRLAIPHKNVPGILAIVSDTLRDAGVNIGGFHNETKNGLGYCIVDFEKVVADTVVESIRNRENILGVRVFRF